MNFINVSQASMHAWPSFLVRAGVAGTGAIVGVSIPKRVTNKVRKSACGGKARNRPPKKGVRRAMAMERIMRTSLAGAP